MRLRNFQNDQTNRRGRQPKNYGISVKSEGSPVPKSQIEHSQSGKNPSTNIVVQRGEYRHERHQRPRYRKERNPYIHGQKQSEHVSRPIPLRLTNRIYQRNEIIENAPNVQRQKEPIGKGKSDEKDPTDY